MASKEIATVEDQNTLPSFLATPDADRAKLQGLSSDDYLIPRIQLLQAGTKAVKDKLPGAVPGIFWLNVLDQPLGEELDFIIISNRIRVLLLAPPDDGQGILARADDGKNWQPSSGEWSVRLKNIREPVKWSIKAPTVAESGLLLFGTSNPNDPQSNPAATKFFDYLVYLPKFNQVAVLSLSRSAAKKAKDLNGKVDAATVRTDLHGIVFRTSVAADNGKGNDFFNYRFAQNGFVQDERVYRSIKDYAKQYATYRVADEADEEAEDTGPAGVGQQGDGPSY